MRITFDIEWDKAEDLDAMRLILEAPGWKSVVRHFDEELRRIIKYDSGESQNTPHIDFLRTIRGRLNTLLADEGLDPYS